MTAPTTTEPVDHVVLTLDGAGWTAPGIEGAMRWTPPELAAQVREALRPDTAAKSTTTREG
jgi:hypothetical protein